MMTSTVVTAVYYGPTWAFVQGTTAANCGGPATSCALTRLTAKTAGSVLMVQSATVEFHTIASVSGGGGSWVLCGATCRFDNTTLNTYYDVAYNLTGTGRGTSVTVTENSSAANGIAAHFVEAKCTAHCGTIVIDALPSSVGNSTSRSTCTGSAVSVATGTSGLVPTWVDSTTSSAFSVASPYVFDTNTNYAYYLNSANGNAASVTQDAGPAFVSVGIAVR